MVKNPTMSFPRKRESKLALYLQSIGSSLFCVGSLNNLFLKFPFLSPFKTCPELDSEPVLNLFQEKGGKWGGTAVCFSPLFLKGGRGDFYQKYLQYP